MPRTRGPEDAEALLSCGSTQTTTSQEPVLQGIENLAAQGCRSIASAQWALAASGSHDADIDFAHINAGQIVKRSAKPD
jgi:hypothetical protein